MKVQKYHTNEVCWTVYCYERELKLWVKYVMAFCYQTSLCPSLLSKLIKLFIGFKSLNIQSRWGIYLQTWGGHTPSHTLFETSPHSLSYRILYSVMRIIVKHHWSDTEWNHHKESKSVILFQSFIRSFNGEPSVDNLDPAGFRDYKVIMEMELERLEDKNSFWKWGCDIIKFRD